jgi:hypothetical protein
MNNHTCDKCLYCKKIPLQPMLRCSIGLWLYERTNLERRIKLSKLELEHAIVEHRDYFDQARRCGTFTSMDD